MARSVEPSSSAPDVSVEAPAKINLFLHVTGRRGDGYHELESLVAFAAVHDRIDIGFADRLVFQVDGPFAAALDSGAENLVVKAARALATKLGVAPRARIRLCKSLPVAAGIGGGSADAAAALRGLSALWGATIAERDLAALGLALGADVPVCLAARPGMVRGIGERIAPVPALPAAPVVLVNPMMPLATAAVFAAREGPFSTPVALEACFGDVAALAAALRDTRNDLAAGARRMCREIDAVLDAIEASPSCLVARMSGSGPTCFGLFPTVRAARRAAARIASARPGWWVCPTRLRASAG